MTEVMGPDTLTEWTIEGGELTPTLKLKRRVVMERHRDLIEDLYSHDAEQVAP